MGCVWGVEEEEERGRREGGRRKGEARRGEALCSREGNEGGRGSSGRARTWKKGIQTHPGTPQRAVWRCHALSPLPSSARRWPSTAVQGLLTGCPCHGRLGAGPGLRWPERGPTPPRALPSMTAPTPRCSADCLRGALRPATTLREAPWKPFILGTVRSRCSGWFSGASCSCSRVHWRCHAGRCKRAADDSGAIDAMCLTGTDCAVTSEVHTRLPADRLISGHAECAF